jgi:uroporphyrinogen-III synthase
VTVVAAYRTVSPAASVEAIRKLFAGPETYPDAVTFTSSSTVRNLFALLDAAGVALPKEVVRASIGPITSETLREFGYPANVEAEVAVPETLAAATVGKLKREVI